MTISVLSVCNCLYSLPVTYRQKAAQTKPNEIRKNDLTNCISIICIGFSEPKVTIHLVHRIGLIFAEIDRIELIWKKHKSL